MKKNLVLLAVALIVMTATAASADFHAGGFDAACVLCQVNHLPLTAIVTTPFIPADYLVPWWTAPLYLISAVDSAFSLQAGRAPPSIR